jgi:hypothetical protein
MEHAHTQPSNAPSHAPWCYADDHAADQCRSGPITVGGCLVWLEQEAAEAEPRVILGNPDHTAELTLRQACELADYLSLVFHREGRRKRRHRALQAAQ